MPKNRTWYGAAGLLAAGALVGGIAAGTMSANAATGSGSSTTPGASSSAAPGGARDGHAMIGGHAGETLLTGSQLATAKAAALEAVPGATFDRAETDSGDAAYEVHMTTSDGTQVTVKLDQSLAVTAVEDGMGK